MTGVTTHNTVSYHLGFITAPLYVCCLHVTLCKQLQVLFVYCSCTLAMLAHLCHKKQARAVRQTVTVFAARQSMAVIRS